MELAIDDGGREAAGYRGTTGDCACRAIAIATGKPYQEVYDLIKEYAKRERPGSKRRKGRRSHPRTGVFRATFNRIMKDLGWTWVPTMGIGTGCTVHLDADELPSGMLIVAVSKHWTVVKDGIIHDTYDPSRDEKRCVYGYWIKIKA